MVFAAIPGLEILEAAFAAPAVERPVPNLGYCCLNMDLREMKPAGTASLALRSWSHRPVSWLDRPAIPK